MLVGRVPGKVLRDCLQSIHVDSETDCIILQVITGFGGPSDEQTITVFLPFVRSKVRDSPILRGCGAGLIKRGLDM